MAKTKIMPQNASIVVKISKNSNITVNKGVWQSNKNVWWESLIKNRGCRFPARPKKLIPAPRLKEFFYAKYDKIVVI